MEAPIAAYLNIARNFYLEDRLDESMQVVEDAFQHVGWPSGMWTEFYNELTCEKDARDSAKLHKVSENISIELDQNAPNILYEDLKATVLEAMKRVGERFSVVFARSILITIFRPDAAVDFIAGSYGYAAHKVNLDKICFPRSIIEAQPHSVMRALMHELTHVAVYELAGDGAYLWLNEGLATYVEGDLSHKEGQFLISTAARSGKMLSIHRINIALSDPKLRKDDPMVVQAAYYLAGSLVEWWADNIGFESIRDALVRIGNGEGVEHAIKHAAKMSIRDIERGWRQHLTDG